MVVEVDCFSLCEVDRCECVDYSDELEEGLAAAVVEGVFGVEQETKQLFVLFGVVGWSLGAALLEDEILEQPVGLVGHPGCQLLVPFRKST